MAFQNSVNTQIVVNEFDMTSYFTNLASTGGRGMYDSTVFGKTAPTFVPGLRTGTVHADGFFSSDATVGSDVVLQPEIALSTPPLVSAAPIGFTIGNRTLHYQAWAKSYALGIKVNSLIVNSVDWEPNDGFDSGVSLHALAAETGSTNSTSVDNSGASSNGGVAFIHATSITSNPSVAVKVQHSTNNSTWVDLVTFTAITAVSSERIVIAAGTTVRQYLRAISTFTGGTSPSLTYTVGFARR